MAQELISNDKSVGIIGGGPSGCICAKFLSDRGFKVNVFDKGKILRTILPTGGGRCNLAHAQFDFKELAKNYPRGEKFLYSLFSKFSTQDSLEFFKSIGVDTYIQEKDNKIFPVSNSSAAVREKFLKSLKKCKFLKENVKKIEKKESDCYRLITDKNEYNFNFVIIAIGGHSDFNLIKNMGINIIPPVPSLVGLITEQNFSNISGVSLKNVYARVEKKDFYGDLLFTHKGVSGPLIYEISSYFARKIFPYNINLTLISDIDLQKTLNENPHKEIKNILGQFIPKSLAEYILKFLRIEPDLKGSMVNSKSRDEILCTLENFKITATGKVRDGEVVTCGGVDLKEINPKTLEVKSYPNLYFCGEVMDIDGFCGGFNLQNCWTTGFVVAQSIACKY